jgi:hypothetical protein
MFTFLYFVRYMIGDLCKYFVKQYSVFFFFGRTMLCLFILFKTEYNTKYEHICLYKFEWFTLRVYSIGKKYIKYFLHSFIK